MKKYNLLLIAFIYFLAFSPSDQDYKQEYINPDIFLYEHKGKLSLGGAFLFLFGINTIFKKFLSISQYPAVKKYNNLSFYKKFFFGVPLSTAFSLVGYIGLSNLPFKREKYSDFVYPKNKDSVVDLGKEDVYSDPLNELKEAGLQIDADKSINDASYLNETNVSAIIKISKEEDIQRVLQIARKYKLKVGIAGARHSMGGQAFVENGLILDMNNFKAMELVDNDQFLRVQSGALFSDIQHFLDQKGFSVKAMQSVNFCTVGGTVAANAHGIAHDPGCIGSTIKSMRVMLTNGSIEIITPKDELFKLVVGGYGLFAIILDVELEVVPNQMYEWKRVIMDYTDFPEYFKQNIENKENIGLFRGVLSVSPLSYLTEILVNTYEKYEKAESSDLKIEKIHKPKSDKLIALPVFEFSKIGFIGRWVRAGLEKYISPYISNKHTSRNQAMCDGGDYLKSGAGETQILQEYFVTPEKMIEFVDALRKIVKSHKVNLLNVTIRSVKKDTLTFIPYAKEDMLAFVLYFNQNFDEKESRELELATEKLISKVNELDGTFYLPYKLYYSEEQLMKAYPEINDFFKLKLQYDPNEILSNTFYEKYKNKVPEV